MLVSEDGYYLIQARFACLRCAAADTTCPHDLEICLIIYIQYTLDNPNLVNQNGKSRKTYMKKLKID